MNQNSKYKLILGSSSPRRRELLGSLNCDFTILKPGFEEQFQPGLEPAEYVKMNAIGKLDWILNSLDCGDPVDELTDVETTLPKIVISADTIVVLRDQVLEKPTDKADAVRMLKSLSGNSHRVLTGVALGVVEPGVSGFKKWFELVKTEVTFRDVSEKEILAYVETGEPMDKAGSYGVQAIGGFLVRSIQGSYTNVVGLPLDELRKMLDEAIAGV